MLYVVFIQVVLCMMSGLLVTLVNWSSSWVVGQAEMSASTGPWKEREWGLLQVWAGLHHLQLSYVTHTMTVIENVALSSRADLAKIHRKALQGGWPWPLVSIMAELGGEGLAWDGQLGGGFIHAGTLTSWLLKVVLYVWGVWVVLFFMAPQLTPIPLMLSGVLTGLATVSYAACVGSRLPTELRVGEALINFQLGSAWWIATSLSLTLTFAGVILHFYDITHPGQLASTFELDFGGEVNSHDPPWERVGPLLAYEASQDTYTQLYPPGHCPLFVQHTQVSTHVLSEKEDPLCSTRKKAESSESMQNTAKRLQHRDPTSTNSNSCDATTGHSPGKQTVRSYDSTNLPKDTTPSARCVRVPSGKSMGGQVRPKFCTKTPSSRSHSKLRSFRFTVCRSRTSPVISQSVSNLVDCEAGVNTIEM